MHGVGADEKLLAVDAIKLHVQVGEEEGEGLTG